MFAGSHITWFAVGAVAAIVLVVAIPTVDSAAIDPLTGQIDIRSQPGLERLRSRGDAVAMLDRLESLAAESDEPLLLAGARAVLRAELGPPDLGSKIVLERLAARPLEPSGLARALATYGDDRAIARATEAFYAGSGRAYLASGGIGPDGQADRLLAELRRGGRPPAAAFIELAERFRRDGRQRARWRWLLRGLEHHPESTELADSLVDVYLAAERVVPALALMVATAAGRDDDLRYWHRRAQVAGWAGRPAAEAVALERVVALAPTIEARRRLISLYVLLGEPEQGLAHAHELALVAGELAGADEAAHAAFAAGEPERGFELLDKVAATVTSAEPWLRSIAELALQDLRVERAQVALEALDDEALEELYRRTDQPEPLAELLERRLGADPSNAGLWHEVIALRYGLGDRRRARDLETRREIALADPERFLAGLDPAEREDAAALRRRAIAATGGGSAREAILDDVLDELRPFLARPDFRPVAEALLRQFHDDPRARGLLIDLLDVGLTPVESARAAEQLADLYAGDVEVVRHWIDRTVWADLVDDQIRARNRLVTLLPDDRENRRQLAEVLDACEDRAGALEHWRYLVGEAGIRAPELSRLIDGLFAVGEEDEAVELLQRLAHDDAADWTDRRAAGEELFHRGAFDQAAVLFRAVVETRPDEPLALLRLGQIHAWTNDPRGAIPYLRRRLRVADEDRAAVEFHLAEAHWAIAERATAEPLHRSALAGLLAVAAPTVEQRSMIATLLARVGRRDEALAAYRELLADTPREPGLLLDYADLLVEDRQLGQARAILRYVRHLAPDSPRLLLAEGRVLRLAGELERADESLARSLALHGADAGVYAERVELLRLRGDWGAALDNANRWLALQTESAAAARTRGELTDALADFVLGEHRLRTAGRDRAIETAAAGSVVLGGDRDRLLARVGHARYRGRATVGGIDTEQYAELGRVELGLEHRVGASGRIGAGAEVRLDDPGESPLGGWLALHVNDPAPYSSLEARLFAGELWDELPGAVALGGRRHGLTVDGFTELGSDLWSFGSATGAVVELDAPGSGRARDGVVELEVALGWRLLDGDIAVTDRLRPRRVPFGPVTPYLPAAPDSGRPWLANAWIGLQSFRLTGDRELAGVLPLARRSEHLVAAARLDRHLARGLGVSASGYAGLELVGGDAVWGVDAGLTWRPGESTDVSLFGGTGSSLQRAGDEQTFSLQAQVVVRW